MQKVCSFVKKPMTVGHSVGFVVDKTKAKLHAKEYYIEVYEIDDYIDRVTAEREINKGVKNGL